MSSSETRLWTLVSEIEPTQAQKEGASRSHNFLRDVIRSGEMAQRITGDFLSGSYSRDTAIRPIDDVDIVFMLNPNAWRSPKNPAVLVDPFTVLDTFASVIRTRYPVSSVIGQRRSVKLELYHLDIDVVPAVPDPQLSDLIWIPDSSALSWIKSSPKRHSEMATKVNLAAGGRVKPLIKLLKFWNNGLPERTRLKSFAIESIVIRLFSNVALTSLESGLITFFDFLSSFSGKSRTFSWFNTFGIHFTVLGGVTIPDVADTGTNIGDGIAMSTQVAFLESAVATRDLLLQSRTLTSPEGAWSLVRRAINAV